MHPIDPRELDEVCEQTESLWDDMRGQRFFITGGTGFFGRWLLESFAAANRRFALNAEVTVLCRSPEIFRLRCPHLTENPAICLLQGDVRSFRFPEGEFPFVIHAAADTRDARTSHEKADALRMISSIFDGTRNTLEFAASHKTRKFLMISSGAVYGFQPSTLSHLPESYPGGPDPCLPGSAYGEAKRAAEALCAAYATPSGLECKIARCFALVGPHLPLDGSYAIGNFIQSVLKAQTIRIHGDGTPLRSYLYATDLTVWLLTTLVRAPSLQPINIGSSQAISIRELAMEVKASLKSNVDIEIFGSPAPGAPPAQYVPSVQKAYDDLGLKQTVALREAIQRTAEWHRRKRHSGVTG
jgi:nucleoside-diphosphate-sugar epimerase